MLSAARASLFAAALSLAFATVPATSAAQLSARDTTLRVDEAAVARALASPEALWAFVTAPETRWADRTAATWRALPREMRGSPESFFALMESGLDVIGRDTTRTGFALPVDYFPRLVAARRELQRERAVHRWGLRRRPNPRSAAATFHGPYRYTGERRRIVLGHVWMVPDTGAGYEPATLGDQRFGPWPAQVEWSLDVLYRGFQAHPVPAEFFAAALRLPCATADDAESLVFETRQYASTHRAITPAVAGAWRNAALNPAAGNVEPWVYQGMYAIGITKTDEAFWLGQALFANLAEAASPGELAALAIHLDWLDSDPRPGWDLHRPAPPHAAILALARGVDRLPATVRPYQRYDAAKDLLQVADTAAFQAFPQVSQTDDAGNDAAFARYRAWFAENRARLEALAAAQRPQVDAARRAMSATRVCRAR